MQARAEQLPHLLKGHVRALPLVRPEAISKVAGRRSALAQLNTMWCKWHWTLPSRALWHAALHPCSSRTHASQHQSLIPPHNATRCYEAIYGMHSCRICVVIATLDSTPCVTNRCTLAPTCSWTPSPASAPAGHIRANPTAPLWASTSTRRSWHLGHTAILVRRRCIALAVS